MLQKLTVTAAGAIEKVNAMPGFNGNTSFKAATLQLFKFYISCAQNEYKQMMNLILAEKQPDNISALLDELVSRVTKNEAKVDEVFGAEQEKFAKANKYELVDKISN